MKKIRQRMYLDENEDIPVRRSQNKRFWIKVMFLVEVSKPLQDYNMELFFD